MLEFPKVGSSRRGLPWLMAKGLKEDYARLVGVPLDEAEHVVNCVGAVIQDRLSRGQPCGIPFVCTLYVKHFDYHIRPGPGIRGNPVVRRIAQKLGPELFEARKVATARLTMRVPREVGAYFRLATPNTGDMKAKYEAAIKDAGEHYLHRHILRKRDMQVHDDVTGAMENRRRRAAWKRAYVQKYHQQRDARLRQARQETRHAIERLQRTEAGHAGGRQPRRGDQDARRPGAPDQDA